MTATLAHRGPDDGGSFTSADGGCRLGHRRLSVIDLAGGHQPLGNEDGSVQTVFNGEVYNFAELRRELEAAGHTFRTRSDTEVLVHGWEEWGTGLADRLRGMFAFAVYDGRSQGGSLYLARDPLGKKPIYWSEAGGELRFGSELKALLADPSLRREVDPEALLLYLTVGYVPDPWCILKGVRKLPPAHWLLARGGIVRVERYWSVPRRSMFAGSFRDATARCRELLTAAVRRRLIADVPLGAFLSGGIDSTVVVGLMAELMDRPVKTFTIGFEDARYDESAFARVAAKRFATEHHEQIVRPDALAVLPTLAHHFDEPFADSSAIPTYLVSKFARQSVTVALTGDGGDEAFGGYRRYRAAKVAGWLTRVPGARSLAAAAGRLIPAGRDRASNRARARRVLTRISAEPASAYLEQMTMFDAGTFAELLSPDAFGAIGGTSGASPRSVAETWFATLYDGADPADPTASAMSADLRSYLPGDLLTKVDRASMAVSLECRSPLLDRDLVEFACSLPTDWRLHGFSGHKHLLKAAAADLLPAEIVHRRKAGFAVPMPAWLRGPLNGVIRDKLLSGDSRCAEWIQRPAVERLAAEHHAGANHAAGLWTLLMLEEWMRRWL